jgi:hypothetical protein
MIDEIKVERHLIRWLDNSYPDKPFYANFGILETPEQEIALSKGLENGDENWIWFDENIFYWISAYLGESIEGHTKEIRRDDFYYVKEVMEKGK